MSKRLTFEEAHGKYPDPEPDPEDGLAWRDQFDLCCCQCERCAPTCRCGSI